MGPKNRHHEPAKTPAFGRRARILWLFACSIVLVWVLFIVSAPIAAASGSITFADPVYGFFSYICHQIPERSFHVFAHQFAVCSRCTGVYFGLLGGLAAYPVFRPVSETDPLPRKWLFLSMLPIAVDWSLGYFGVWDNTQLSRVITGLILGVACAVFIVPALAEISAMSVARTQAVN